MGIRRHQVLIDQSAAGTGPWFRLDARYEVDPERAIQVSVGGGDSITLEAVTVDGSRTDPEWDPNTDIVAGDITTLITYTADDNDILTGNWTYIRAIKTGAAGNGKLEGFI
jgi:hypothetical protein